MDGFGEGVAFLEEVVEVRLLVAVWADMDAEILVWFMGVICGDGDFGVGGCCAIANAYVDGGGGCFGDLVSAM